MKSKILSFAMIALAMMACKKQPQGGEDPTPSGPATFTATFAPVSKVSFNGTALAWQASDALSVFSGSDAKNYKYTTKDNGASAKFEGEAPSAASYVAVYPYDESLKAEGGAVKVTIPTDQLAVAGSCAQDAIVTVAGSNSTNLEFRTAGALVKFKVNSNEPVASATLSAVGMNDKLSGEAKVTASANGLKVSSTTASEDHVTVGGGLAKNETYYVVAMPGNYVEGLTINFKNEEGKVVTKEIAKIKLEAGVVADLGIFDIEDGDWLMSYELDGDDAVFAFTNAHDPASPKESVRDLTVKNCMIYCIRELKSRVKEIVGTFTMVNILPGSPGGQVYMAMFELEGSIHSFCIKDCPESINPAFFPELKSKVIEGNLIIDNCPKMELNRTDGSTPGTVTEVKGDFIINNCDHVNGTTFKNLAKVGGDLIITNNTKSWDLREKTTDLVEIGGNLVVKGNPEFQSAIGFTKLTKIGGDVTFFAPYIPNEDNPEDLNIKGLKIFKTYLDNGVVSKTAKILIGRDEASPIDVNSL